jgi:hypothetical protein
MKCLTTFLIASCLLLSSCQKKTPDSRLYPGLEESPVLKPTTTFERLSPDRSGIKFVPSISDEHRYNFMADPYIYNGGGVAVLDVNNDGLQDLFFTARLQGCRLYLNKGNLTFEDISEAAGIAKFSGLKTGVTAVDINADGWLDIYVCRTWLEPVPDRRNLLFINNKDNTFSEQAAAYKLDDLSASQQANFFDYDLDGDLDCYIVNHPVDFKTMNNLDYTSGSARKQGPRNEWESDRLLKNLGGRFEDVTASAGVRNRAFGLSSIAADFNDDGWPDLFVGNDFVMPDFLYINQQNGTFKDEADQYFRHTSNHTMGADLADINDDGLSDLVALDMLAQPFSRRQRLMSTMQLSRDKQMQERGYGRQVMRNTLQLSNGKQGFNEIGYLSGIAATDWSWAPLLADFDNDGGCDLFISNGIQRDLNDLDFFVFTADSINRTGGVSKNRFPNFNDFAAMMPSEPVHNYAFHNNGSLHFDDVSAAWGFDQKGFSNGAAYSDLDNDGDLDLITNNLQAAPSIYENKAIGMNRNNWLQIKCQGSIQNPFGIGAKVRVYARKAGAQQRADLIFSQEMTNVRGFYSSVEPIFQVGLGSIEKIDQIEIDWPENKHQILLDIPVNQRIILKANDALPGKCPPKKYAESVYITPVNQTLGLDFVHHENNFEDFDREKLLPYRLSRTGPSISVGDLNGDGLEDVFLGGAAGQSAAIYLQKPDGRFAVSAQPALELDKSCEDTASALFDADGDGDLDLYVVSGGNEAPAGSAQYQDRLYLNNGQAALSAAKSALPVETSSGSCVQVFDFDNDGKKDVFVGGRAIPGRFPEVSESMLLKNEGGVFKNVTASLAPEFQKAGMVTDLQLGDLDGDGKTEMVVAGDWMPIMILQWNGKAFVNNTANFGLQNSTGLWRCLTLADLDGDGDLDIVAGNLGLNTRFHATGKAPLKLFAPDFDFDGRLDPILGLAESGNYYPAIQRDFLATQLPYIKKKFTRNTPFANATLIDIFSAKELLAGTCLEAKTMETMWFKNEQGKFTRQSLPDYAQFSSTEKILVDDFTADGIPDILTLGNEYGMEVESYQLDASDGFVFRGNGQGNFSSAPMRVGAFGEVRDAAILHLKSGKKVLLVANNDGPVQIFSLPSSKN